MKRVLVLLMSAVLMMSLLSGCENKKAPAGLPPGENIFVAPNGSDFADGSFERPFLTLGRAKVEVRALTAGSDEPVTVNIRGGEYYFDHALHLTAEDSGTEAAPVTWRAYNGESVLLSGGIRLSPEDVKPVTDEAIVSRVLDSAAREKLVSVDLSGYLDEWPDLIVPDSTYEVANGGPEIYINDAPLTQSRWPNDVQNEAYLYADSAEALSDEQFTPVRLTSRALAERAGRWSSDAWRDMFVYAFMAWDWSEGIFDAASFDAASGEIVTTGGHWGPPSENPRFYVFNLPEEIDVPGESYIDYERKTVYFYPPEDLTDAQITLPILQDALITLDGAHHLTFRGLSLKHTRSNSFAAYRADAIAIDGCTVAHSSAQAIVLDDATNCAVRNCHIYDTGNGGIYLWDGGLRKSLTPSGNIIENNDIHHTNRLKKCYYPPIWCESFGVVIRSNEIHDINHIAVDVSSSNDAVIEYNVFYNTCLETSDAGAIYYGRNPSVMGIEIRYNYFHDIGNRYGGIGQQAIFCDDGASMPHIYGNLFVSASDKTDNWGSAIKANGAQFGLVENNIFVDMPYAALFGEWPNNYDRAPVREDWWLMSMYGAGDPPGEGIWQKITVDIDLFSELWREHYRGTQWEPVWDVLSPEGHDEFWRMGNEKESAGPPDYDSNPAQYEWAYQNAPERTNLLRGNVCVNITGESGIWCGSNAREENNLIAGTELFSSYENGDFALTPQGIAEIRKVIPGFEEIPMSEIGRKP